MGSQRSKRRGRDRSSASAADGGTAARRQNIDPVSGRLRHYLRCRHPCCPARGSHRHYARRPLCSIGDHDLRGATVSQLSGGCPPIGHQPGYGPTVQTGNVRLGPEADAMLARPSRQQRGHAHGTEPDHTAAGRRVSGRTQAGELVLPADGVSEDVFIGLDAEAGTGGHQIGAVGAAHVAARVGQVAVENRVLVFVIGHVLQR